MDALDDLFSSEVGGGASTKNSGLDTLNGLDSLENLSDMNQSATAETKTELARGDKSTGGSLDDFDPLEAVTDPRGLNDDAPKPGVKDMGQLDSLDVLDSFPSVTPLTMDSNGRTGLKRLLFIVVHLILQNSRPVLLVVITANRGRR